MSKETGIPVPKLALILRNFFLESFPYLDEYFNSIFHMGNMASENLNLSFKKIAEEKKILVDFYRPSEDDVLSGLEVTLFEEWPVFIKKLKKHLHVSNPRFNKFNPRQIFISSLKHMMEVAVILLLGWGIIIGTKNFNKWYEKILIGKIELFSPKKNWESKKSIPKKMNLKELADLRASAKKFEEIQNEKVTGSIVEEEFETESEVILTSWKALPKDFNIAELEQSEYEEFFKRGIRDNRYGNRKIFRVMMESIHPERVKQKLDDLIANFKAEQVDNVRPGKSVPGGLYYNIFVPQKYLKEFLARVMETEEATLYETRTRIRNPPGKNRVFIWIKIL